MKLGFYPRLAWSGIRKNKRLFVPYILATAGTAAVFYILFFLASSNFFDNMRGGSSTKMVLSFGVFVIVAFALLFLFYCNSFLVRRRYKEFGLYSILGMNKHNISRILAWETLFTALLSLLGGVFIGVLLSKLAEMAMLKVLGGTAEYALHISLPAIEYMLLYFGGIFLLIFLNSVVRIRRLSASELVRSENYGEKPAKANPILGGLGVLVLGVAYYLAVSIEQPLQALTVFFIAVLMVIAATYLIFIAGSVVMCRLLQKNKRYYYKPEHFVSVSSMAYRMKRNGAGLASICILATMVLVMISSTSCLYFGGEESLHARYPRDIVTSSVILIGDEYADAETEIEALRSSISAAIAGRPVSNVMDYRSFSLDAVVEQGHVMTNDSALSEFGLVSASKVASFLFIPLSDYNRAAGAHEILGDGEVLVHASRTSIDFDTLDIDGTVHLTVKRELDEMPLISGSSAASVLPTITVIVPGLDELALKLADAENPFGGPAFNYTSWNYCFDTPLKDDDYASLYLDVMSALRDKNIEDEHMGFYSYSVESLEYNRSDFAGTFGGLFFLGVILSLVFGCAAVLIIYYKQLSEGYEDAGRFEIMQKVGMTKQEIRRSINSQLLTVFFLPLLFAGLHLCFAFPFIRKILYMFSFYNTSFLIWTTVISFLVFALLYALVYKKTSNTYYKIVSK
ncbi:MAG: FtsX-like permease family protein [Oscillospiraceae bacterium]|nr:FtsX-like permease family protein [Oscillospiraceae bacterium]